MSINIERLNESNLQDACDLADASFPEEHVLPSRSFHTSLDPDQSKSYAKETGTDVKDMEYWVATDDNGRVLGTIGLYSRNIDIDEARWLGWYCVHPDARGKNVGSQLLDFAITQAKQRAKILRILTSDHPTEAKAQGLYEKRGLSIVREYDAPGEGFRWRIRELLLKKN